MQARLDRNKQRPQAERDVLDPAVDEEGRRATHAALDAALEVLAHALQVDVIVHLGGEPSHVKADPFGVAVEVLRLEVRLVGEEEVVRGPEFPLAAGGLGGAGRGAGVRAHALEREIPKREARTTVEALEQQLQRRLRLLAVRALEIAILDDRHGRVRAARQMIDRAHRDRELERSMPRHTSRSLRSGPATMRLPATGRPSPVRQMDMRWTHVVSAEGTRGAPATP